MVEDASRETILVVDDFPATVRTLEVELKEDYEVKTATSGSMALELIKVSPPDLILLDIMMPIMDGYELCRLLKAHESYKSIPIIFITALTDEEDEAKGLALGAVDFLVKPINTAIVKARVRTHLELKRHRRQLEEMVVERTLELNNTLKLLQAKRESEFRQAAQTHSSRLAAMGEMAASMAHEINQPLNVISITVQSWQLLEKRGGLTMEKMIADSAIVVENVKRITRLIDHVQTLGQTSQEVCDVDFVNVVQDCLSMTRMQLLEGGVAVDLDIEKPISPVQAVRSEIEQVVLNLLSNARFVLAEKREKDPDFQPLIKISLKENGDTVCLAVEDNGGGVDPMVEKNLFDPFFTTKPVGQGTGLGLSISKKLMRKFDGKLTLANNVGHGARFEMTLPKSRKSMNACP